MRRCSVLATLTVVWLACGLAEAQDVEVRAEVSEERVGVEDTLSLTVTVSGAFGGISEPKLPRLDGFRAGPASTSTEMSIVNGRRSASTSFLYQLLPQREGTFTIGAIEVEVGGRTYRTEPLSVEVVAGSVVPRRPPSRSPLDGFGPFGRSEPPAIDEDDVFMRTELSGERVYEGEPVAVTYWLYSRFVPLGCQLEDDPPLTGFWVEEVESDRRSQGERRVVDGREYYALPVLRRVLVPTQAGELSVPPVTFSTALRFSVGDPFDLLSARASRAITLRTPAASLDVEPLPTEGRTSAFTGAVGRFELDAAIDREEVRAGDAVTLTLSLSGKGQLRAVGPPKADLTGFRAFDPKTQETTQAGAEGLEGTKRWEYVLVPETPGAKELGPWTLQYFDPGQGEYVTASAGPLALNVTAAPPTDASGGVGRRDGRPVTLLREDIRYLKDPPDRLGDRARAFHESPLFYAALALPVMWNLALLLVLRRRERERTHSHVFRSRRARRMAHQRLKRAAQLARQGSKGFYEEIAAALYRYVADKLSVSPSGLTASGIDRMLDERDVPEETRRELLDVLARCEEARFTPVSRSPEEMEALRARTEKLIVGLEKLLG